jgi:glycosyltransferase involved in cell wall biosynthesis
VTKRLRILHCFRAPVGGLFRHVLDLSAEQAARGHDVGFIVDSRSADRLTEERLTRAIPHLALGIARIPMGRLPGPRDLVACRAVLAKVHAVDAHVLHGHGAKGGAYARLVRAFDRATGGHVASFYTPHGGSLHFSPGSAQAFVYIGIEKVLARFTDGIIFESDYVRQLYERRVGKDLAPTRVITNALQPADFIAHEPVADAADFLFVGELRKLKGIDVLLDALVQLHRRPPVRAVIVGSGPDRAEFEGRAHELGLDSRVVFTGAMPAAMAFPRGRCIVVPSRNESLPYIVLEAAAAEIPLIATNVGGIPEIVQGSDTSLLPPGNVEVLVGAMQAFLDAPQAAKVRAHRLKQLVHNCFAIAAATTAVLDFYRACLPR